MLFRPFISAAAATWILSTIAAAQQITIVGTITNQSRAPVPGAVVTLRRLRLSAQTTDAGTYRITLPADRAGETDTLRVTRLGSAPRVVAVTFREGTNVVDVTLAEQATALNEVVVTGTAGNQERRAQPAVVASVDAASLVKTAPISNIQQLLSGRVAGVDVTQTNGSVGSTSVIRIRGVSSISLSNEPLIFIDGVRVDNRNVPIAGGAVSTLNDIDPSTIETLEVVKGPAAATLYGADASAGVIQIITKKGLAGQNRFAQTVTLEQSFARPHWTPPSNFATCSAANVAAGSPSTLCLGQQPGAIVSDNPIVREDLLRTGKARSLGWQGRGGGPNVGYFLAYSYANETGTVPANDLLRHSVRTNFSILPLPSLTIETGLGVSQNINDQVNVGDNIYGLLTALIGNPITVGTPTNGWFAPGRTGVAIASIQNRLTTTRVEPNVSARYTPVDWFTNRITLGADISRLFYHQFFPKNDLGWYAGNNNSGAVREDRNSFDIYTVDYLGDIKRDLPRHWAADLSFGAQLIDVSQDSLTANGYGLATNASNTVTATTTNSAGGGRWSQRSVGYLGQLQLSYANKLFLQYGARIDRNSSFADATQMFYLPKYGVSYVISEEPWWQDHLRWVPTLRLRGAYGTTGRAPQPGAALQTYSSAPFVFNNGAQGAGVMPLNPGNANLRAERGTEFETGFEASALDERLGIDFTFFRKVTKDLLIQRPIAPSLGFTQNPFVNIGSVLNSGIELAVRGQLITTRNVALESRVSLSTLHNELTSLGGVAPFRTGLAAFNEYRETLPLGAWFTPRVLSVDAARGVAVVSDTSEYGGSPIPTYQGTFTSDLTLFQNFRLNGLVEFKGGNRKLNTSIYFREKAFTQEERFQRRASLPIEEQLRLFGPYVNSQGKAVAGSVVAADYLDDASFVRLREVSLSMTAPSRFAERLRVSSATLSLGARNLKLWTSYKGGWDPESITYVPTSGVFFSADFLTMPAPQRFFARLSLGF